jgi:hypothetical protein
MESLSNYLISTIIKTYKQNHLYLDNMSNQAKLFTPIGTRAIGLAWANVIKSFETENPHTIRGAMRVLAGSPGKPEITQKFKGWILDVDRTVEVEKTGHGYTDAEQYPKHQRIEKFLLEQYYDIYDKLISLLNEMNLLDFETGAKPKFEKKGHLAIPTT